MQLLVYDAYHPIVALIQQYHALFYKDELVIHYYKELEELSQLTTPDSLLIAPYEVKEEATCYNHFKCRSKLFLGAQLPEIEDHDNEISVSYLPLPFPLVDLFSFYRRVHNPLPYTNVQLGNSVQFNPHLRTLMREDKGHPWQETLTVKESILLYILFENEGSVVAKERLLKEIWGIITPLETHTLETHIYRLRQKLADQSITIQSEEGGYRLVINNN